MGFTNDCEVVIGGKVITLSGAESEEYLQKVAAYLNGKIQEVNASDSFRRQPLELQNIYIQLNIADDYFKALDRVKALEEDLDLKDRELYDLKQSSISAIERQDSLIRSRHKGESRNIHPINKQK